MIVQTGDSLERKHNMKKIIYLACLACGLYVGDSFGVRPIGQQQAESTRVAQLNRAQLLALKDIVINKNDRHPENVGFTRDEYRRFFRKEATEESVIKALGLIDAFGLSKHAQKKKTRSVAARQLNEDELNGLKRIVDTYSEYLDLGLKDRTYRYLVERRATESEVAKALGLIEAFSSPETQSDEDSAVDALAEGIATVSLSDENPNVLADSERIARVTKFFIDNGSRELSIFSEFLSDKNPLGTPQGKNDKFVKDIQGDIKKLPDATKLIMDEILELYQEDYQQFKMARLNAFFRMDRDTFLRFLSEENPLEVADFAQRSSIVRQVAYDLSNVDAMSVENKLFLDGVLNANWSKYQQFKRSHLFVTGLPNSRPMVEVLDTRGDGDCAFRAMAPEDIWQGKTGATRTWAANLLLGHIGDAEVRRHIGAEIAYRRANGTLPRAVSAALTRAKGDTTAVSVVKSYIENFVKPHVGKFAARERFTEANYLEMPSPAMANSVATALAYLMQKNLIVINAEDGTVLYDAGNSTWPNLIVAQDGPNHVCRTKVTGHLQRR